MGSRQSSTARSSSTHSAGGYSPLDRIAVRVCSRGRPVGTLRADTTDMTVRSRTIPGQPAIAVISIVIQNNGPAIYIKSLNGFQLEVVDDGDRIDIVSRVSLHPGDGDDRGMVPFYIPLNPALNLINFIDRAQ
jgi:hypothetical protein